MTEEQDLLTRISQLTGKINQHKNQASNSEPVHTTSPGVPHTAHAGYGRSGAGWAPYRGRSRPYAGRKAAIPHRNHTLVLNNNAKKSSDGDVNMEDASASTETDSHNANRAAAWITKRDGKSMQLINSTVYSRDAQAKTKAIEETRKLKAQNKDDHEKTRVMQHLRAMGANDIHPASSPGNGKSRPSTYKVYIQDLPFQVMQGGSKLVRLSEGPNAAYATPKKVNVGGVTFVRSRNGNLYRLSAVKSKRGIGKVKKRDELCKRFTTTGTCHKGPHCRYIHDPNKTAICKNFLQTGTCPAGDACDLSHVPSPERSPVCSHFLRGRCTKDPCRYSHVRVAAGAPVCHSFATLGYCEKGASCDERHVHECPAYSDTGTCSDKKCSLPHVDRAGQFRKQAAHKTGIPDSVRGTGDEADEDDISSDDDRDHDAIDSDDVDSDDLQEPEEILADEHGGLSPQQDYVRLS